MKSSADILKSMRTQSAGNTMAEYEASPPPPPPKSPGKSPGKSPKSPATRILTLKGVVPMNLGLDRVMTVRTGGHTPEFDALVPPGGQPGQIWHFKVPPLPPPPSDPRALIYCCAG